MSSVVRLLAASYLRLGLGLGIGFGGGLGALLAPSAAHAGPAEGDADESGATIVIAPLQVEGELSQEATAKLEEELVTGLERGGIKVVRPGDIQTGGAELPCGEKAGCIVKLARANQATHVLQVMVTKTGRDYSLEMILSSGADGSEQAKSAQDCEICGLQELGDLIGNQAAALQPKLQAVPGTLIVETSPSGATVRIDGKLVGVTPIVEPIPAGEHTITISKPGYLDRERMVTVVAGSEETIEIGLQAAPVEEGPKTVEPTGPDGKGMRIGGFVSLGVGVAAVGAGVALIMIDEQPVPGRCFGDNIDENNVCRFRRNTLGSGIGIAAAGGGALVAGAVLVALGYKKKKGGKKTAKDASARVLPTHNGILIRF